MLMLIVILMKDKEWLQFFMLALKNLFEQESRVLWLLNPYNE